MRKLLLLVVAIGGLSGCHAGKTKFSCDVRLGRAHAITSVGTNVGSTAVASVGTYTVFFSVERGPEVQAALMDSSGNTLMSFKGGGFRVRSGTLTPAGSLVFSCVP